MATVMEPTELVKSHRSPPGGMEFYETLESVRSDASLPGYVAVMERAWQVMELSGIVCLDGRPVLYLKEYAQPPSPSERIALQRLFWNQGVANVLVLADPTSVFIYSGLAKPPDDPLDEKKHESVLVEALKLADYVQDIRTKSLYHALATGHYYELHREKFDPNQSVDWSLLTNLRDLRNALVRGDEPLEIKHAHAIIGRVLFLCYLLDRGIVSVGQAERGRTGTMQLAEILERKSHDSRIAYLYELFNDLKDQFNGNMFDQDLEAERLLIRAAHIQNLTLFLGGHDVGRRQRTLGLWPYDFKMIPVETISAIYQDFLAAEDPKSQEKSGAYYTPRFLAEMVVDVAIEDNPDALDWTFLDPACGSGVFLVILFNRLANHWLRSQSGPVGYVAKAEAMQEILGRRIRGIDASETACRIACFSLYLAYLDFFEPPDIRDYVRKTGKPLPKLLDYGDSPDSPRADIPVVYRGDALNEATLAGKTFDCVIGNPPWEGRQNKQLAQQFMYKAPVFLRSGGTGCLLLPSKMLQNRTDAFQAQWLGHVRLGKVLQLADYSFLLFQDAKCPAFIALFSNTPPQPNRHKVEFVAPKFNREGLRQGIITVSPSDRTWIPLSEILAATKTGIAPVVWKRRLWGTSRDQKFLDYLLSMPPLSELAGSPREGKRWTKGQGFQPNTSGKSKTPKSPWWNRIDPYISAKAPCWDMKCIQLDYHDCEIIGDRFQSLRRSPDRRIHRSPMVLISQGFGKVAFCDFDVLFQDSLQSISGPEEDTGLLMFLAGYLRSSLAKYFLFHTSANWGSERDKVHLVELLRVPFPLPQAESVSPDAAEIVSEVAEKMREFQRKRQAVLNRSNQVGNRASLGRHGPEVSQQWKERRRREADEFQQEIEPLFHRYFGLTEQEVTLLEDTIRVFEPSATPSTRWSGKTVTLMPVERSTAAPYRDQGLRAYADTLTKTLNAWAREEGSAYRVSAKGESDEKTGLAMVTLRLSSIEEAYRRESPPEGLSTTLEKLYHLARKTSGTLRFQRDLFLFHHDLIYIVRPNVLLNWTRTVALNDAARIYGDIALAAEAQR